MFTGEYSGVALRLQNVRGIVIDEADACLADKGASEAMAALLQRMNEAREKAGVPPPQTVLAGASLSPPLVKAAVEAGWVRAPGLVSDFGWAEGGSEAVLKYMLPGGGGGGGQSIRELLEAASAPSADADGDAPSAGEAALPSSELSRLGWDEQRVPAGAAHEYVVTDPSESVAVLCRLLRERFEAAAEPETNPPRVVVFAPSAEKAVELAGRLQGALFSTISGEASAGLWGLSVLLPSAESRLETTSSGEVDEDDDVTLSVLESSLKVIEMFACNLTSVLVTTAAATRGLDFPQARAAPTLRATSTTRTLAVHPSTLARPPVATLP